ncbi:MAG: metal ABC transporter permease [Micrococcaceae bacterium]
MNQVFNFTNYSELLPLMAQSIYAALVLGVVGGVVGVFVQARQAAFAVHGISELSFSGAALFLLLGWNVVIGSIFGSIIAAILIAVLGWGAKGKNQSMIGILMPVGLGLGILFISLYQGRSANKFGLLTGQIVAVESSQLTAMVIMAAVVLVSLAAVGRPLLFASVDRDVAQVHGVPVKALDMVFMIVLGIATAMSVHIVGSLLVMALLVTPAVSASYVAKSPVGVFAVSVACGVIASVGGVMLSLGGNIPVSPYITTLSFILFVICWSIGHFQAVRGKTRLKT